MSSTDPPISQKEIVATYRQLNSELQSLIQQLTKAEMERNEHCLVEETLEPLDPDRRAFRLVGGVLRDIIYIMMKNGVVSFFYAQVERTVREVLPSVKENRVNLDNLIKHIEEKTETKRKETFAWKAKYNIKTQEEIEAAQRQ
ncbi:hypothetical protein ACHAWC_001312 [Mediolabrus comicus]